MRKILLSFIFIFLIGFASAAWTADLNTNITAYWTFNENGNTLIDSIAGIHNATLLEGSEPVKGVSGLIDNSWNFTNGGYAVSNLNGLSNNSITINVWFNASGNSIPSGHLFRFSGGVNGININVNETIHGYYYGCAGITTINTGVSSADKKWHMVTFEQTPTDRLIYVDSVLKTNSSCDNLGLPTAFGFGSDGAAGEFFLGKIDEAGFWNATLTQSQINALYNGGAGITYNSLATSPISNANITLNTPVTNSSVYLKSPIVFDSFIAVNNQTNITNATLNIWYSNSTLWNSYLNLTVTQSTAKNISTIITWNITNFPINNFTWNVLGCFVNSTTNFCQYALSNFTFRNLNFIENSQSFKSNTTIGSNENFGINITYDSSYYNSISAILTYNNTNYTGTQTGSGDNVIFNSSIVIPSISGLQKNYTFFWNLAVTNSSGTSVFFSSKNIQGVNTISLDDCTVNTLKIFNYTLYDEDSRSMIVSNPSINATTTIQIFISIYNPTSNSIVYSFNNSYSNVSSVPICISSNSENSTYSINSQIRYSSTNYVTKYYNQQQAPIIISNISLYDLLTTRSQEFAITVKDANRLLLNNVLVRIDRQYLPIGGFLTVEIPATNGGGTIGHFVLSSEIYNLYVYRGQTLLGTFPNYHPVCQNIAAGQCNIELDLTGVGAIPISNPYAGLGIYYNQSYNPVSRIYSINFQSQDGSTKTVVLNVSTLSPSLNDNICIQSLTSSVGTLQCNIPSSIGNGTGYASVTVNGNILYNEEFVIPVSYSALFGYNIFFFVAILVLVLPLMAISNGPLILIFFIVGIVAAGGMFALNLGNMIGAGSALLWLIVAVLILLYKVFSGRQP